MATWTDEYLLMLRDCEKRESRLSEWEKKFIVSLRKWLKSGGLPSPRQLDKLDQVWDRATKAG